MIFLKQIKILSLGDESVRTTHNYLPKIARCDSCDIVAGTAFKAGATLKTHIESLSADLKDYCFICNKEGSVRFDTTENTSLSQALDWLSWDFVIIHQSFSSAGDADSYIPYASELEKMIKEICPCAKVVLNVPYVNGAFEACLNAIKNSDIRIILPVYEAWKAIENNGICLSDENVTLSSRENDFLTACVCYEVLTGNDVSRSNYRLPFVESDVTAGIKKAVHSVVNSVRCFYGR